MDNETVNAQRYLTLLRETVVPCLIQRGQIANATFMQDGATSHTANPVKAFLNRRSGKTESTATAGSDVVQSGRPIFDDFFQHLWPYIGNNTANVVFQMVKRLWLISIDQ
ncbi:hypothetical protein TNCV_560451 [Trichonephila clavipes]|nr:hypothetical protein TNCV_560451 [Trichonephila clavipes]